MESVLQRTFRYAEIKQDRACLYALQQRGYNRFNSNLNTNTYPEPRFCPTATVSKSGIPYQRLLHFMPPLPTDRFDHIFFHLQNEQVQPAHLYDGLEFVANYYPYLNTGEIVVGFPGLLRQNHSEKFVPLLIISGNEIAWDESPISGGWQPHWWAGAIL